MEGIFCVCDTDECNKGPASALDDCYKDAGATNVVSLSMLVAALLASFYNL